MGEFFTAILKKIADFALWIGGLAAAGFAAMFTLGKDILSWLLEQILDVVIWLLNQIDLDFDLFNPAQYVSALPPEMVMMIGYLRIGECLAIIIAAIIIRIGLQLIPFTRLGS